MQLDPIICAQTAAALAGGGGMQIFEYVWKEQSKVMTPCVQKHWQSGPGTRRR